MKCSCGCDPVVVASKGIYLVKCENCGRFSTGDTVEEAKQEWEWRMKHEKSQ